MTDKQIIDLTEIDQKYKDKCSLIKAGKCKNVNIFIEQSRKLKSKEQECEKLKIEVKQIGTAFIDKGDLLNNALDKINQLKAENIKFTLESRKLVAQYSAKLDQLKQTLAVIKEIAEKGDMPPCMEVNCNCTNCEDEVTEKGSRCMQYSLKQILQKISEVENG